MEVPRPTPESVFSAMYNNGGNSAGDVLRARQTGACKSWPEVDPSHVSRWDDFTLANLALAYQDILTNAPSIYPVTPWPPQQLLCIDGHESIKKMASDTFCATLLPSITDGVSILKDRMNIDTASVSMKQSVPLGHNSLAPPMTFFLNGTRRLVFGATRMSEDWDYRLLTQAQPPSRAFFPFRQLAAYAQHSNTPYTFIVTEREVVVVRFFLVDRDKFGAQWQAIPWGEAGHNGLTPNLAMWFLIMMSLNEDYRQVRTKQYTPATNVWLEAKNPL